MEKLLSIVVPVYNVEKYIERCLNSLLVPRHQLESLDIVVVNDETPDNSAVIARRYEKNYPGIFRVIDQENRGHGGAWNHGTELAVGKYLFYLDSDDWFDTGELSRLITYLEHCDTDMVCLDSKIYHAEDGVYTETNRHVLLVPDVVYDADKYDWLATGCGNDMTYAHDTVYRTSMMQQYLPLFCEKVMYDDVALQAIPIALAKNFVYVKLNIYRYYLGRPGQSYDPKVRAARAADDVTKVLAFALSWVRQHKHVIPRGGTREAYTDKNYQSMGTWRYRELAEFHLAIAAPRLKTWDKFIRTDYPEIRPNVIVYLYRYLPVWIFIFIVRCHIFAQRCSKYILRKLTK